MEKQTYLQTEEKQKDKRNLQNWDITDSHKKEIDKRFKRNMLNERVIVKGN